MNWPEKQICHLLSGKTVDWQQLPNGAGRALLAAAVKHGVQGLLYYSVQTEKKTGHQTPVELAAQLHHCITQQAATELNREQSLQRIVKACKCSHISMLIIKGESLARTIYAHPECRERADIDLFIAPDQIEKMYRCMEEIGLHCDGPVYKSHQFSCLDNQRNRSGCHYDVHWRINNKAVFARVLTFKEAMAQAEPLPGISSDFVQTLCSSHALLLACVHLAQAASRNLERLIWYYDIYLLYGNMDESTRCAWAEMAVEKNIHQICKHVLEQTSSFFDMHLSDNVRQLLCANPVESDLITRIQQSNLGLFFYDLLELPDLQSRKKLVKELLLPDSAQLLKYYHKQHRAWLPVLYLHHGLIRISRRFMLR